MLKKEGIPLEIIYSKSHFTVEKMEVHSDLPKVPHLVMVVGTKTLVSDIPRILSNATCCLTSKESDKVKIKNNF